MEKLAAEVGDIDILINNAGDIPAGSLDILDDAAGGAASISRCSATSRCRGFIIRG